VPVADRFVADVIVTPMREIGGILIPVFTYAVTIHRLAHGGITSTG
jgi:hypothetical protein